MQQSKETRFSLWTIWSYENEEKWINELSEQGLHLETAHPFWSTFRRDPSVRYTYRLDYQPALRDRERVQEYVQLYEDAGWEHTHVYFGMWHYFRRPWRPGEEQVLYTDRSSLKNHYQRIRRVLGGVLFANVAIGLSNLNLLWFRSGDGLPAGAGFILAVQAVVVFLLGSGYGVMGRKIKALAGD